jgi:hypothetical protein
MATVQVIEDSFRNYIIKVTGAAAEAAALLVDVSALNPACDAVTLLEVQYDIAPASTVELLWDATSDVSIGTFSEGPGQTMCFRAFGGIPNNSGAGKTGDVMITKVGTTGYSMILWFKKDNPAIPR